MRLINTTTLRFREFFGSEIPIYAILSHKWESVEVSFQQFMAMGANDFDRPEYKKILECCSFTARQGYSWVWIDTCCIDKHNSTELTESINSMFRWYQRAVECYVYLRDVELDGVDLRSQFRASEWWDRGWTLQELLAPDKLIFVDSAWRVIGHKDQMAVEISSLTGISERYLRTPEAIYIASVAARMSWASRRKTQRPEDRAYSLLGIFGINMPLLYGEGGRAAFRRLQLEILKTSDDESIFVWLDKHSARRDSGLLAMWPEDFADTGNAVPHMFVVDRPAYSMTHKGLKLHVPSNWKHHSEHLIIMPLNCRKGDNPLPVAVTLYSDGLGHWFRTPNPQVEFAPDDKVWSRSDCLFPYKATIYVREPNTYK